MGSMGESADLPIDASSGMLNKIFKMLTRNKQEKWMTFVKQHNNHGRHVSGNGLSIELMPDTIGDYIILIKCGCGKQENITDFSNW